MYETPDILSHTSRSRTSVPPCGPVHKLTRRLNAETVAAIVVGYKAGVTAKRLGLEFGLAKSSVLVLLRREGVVIRRPRLTPADRRQAVAPYRKGVPQVEIARRFGRHKGAIWHLLNRPGALSDD